MESISFCLLFMSSFSSLLSVLKSLILVCRLSTVPWSIAVEEFWIFADVNNSFFMIWISSVKNNLIAIILWHSFASSESNFELNDELMTEFKWNHGGVQGVTNDPILAAAIVGSDMWVGMTGFVVTLMTSQSNWSVIQISSCMMEKLAQSYDNVIKGLWFSLTMPFVCIPLRFASTDSSSQLMCLHC